MPRDGMCTSATGHPRGYATLKALRTDTLNCTAALMSNTSTWTRRWTRVRRWSNIMMGRGKIWGDRIVGGFRESVTPFIRDLFPPSPSWLKWMQKRREEHWYNGEAIEQKVRFGSAWRISKPKFICIRGMVDEFGTEWASMWTCAWQLFIR